MCGPVGVYNPSGVHEDLLLAILIPGYRKENLSHKPANTGSGTGAPAAEARKLESASMDFPTKFQVEVDGELFNVKVSPLWGEGDVQQAVGGQRNQNDAKPKDTPSGAMVSDLAGLVLSINVKVGDQVNEGDLVAVIEAMKLMRNYLAPHAGKVKEICVREGEIINADDILMILE